MKKNTLFLTIIIILIVFIFASCQKAIPTEEESTAVEPLFQFETRTATEEREDGWVYYFTYSYSQGGEPYYGYDAYNLKYTHIEGYDIPIIDEETSKIIDYTTSSIPYLSLNQSSRPELERIDAFFMEKEYTKPVTLADLDGLQTEQIKKEEVLHLFNEAMERGDLPDGKYAYLSEADIVQEASVLSGYQWQIGYIIMHGNILNLRIELLYDGTTHLSNLVEDGKADDAQKSMQQKIQEIQKQILEKQSFTAANESPAPKIGSVKFERLFSLLQQIEDRNKKPA